jgi:hypothetical protein
MAAKITRYEGTLMTPEARLIWVYLFKPKKFDNGNKYCTDIIFNPAQMETPEFKAMKAAANEIASKHFGDRLAGMVQAEKFTSPFWKNERKIDPATGKLPDGYEPGGVYITVKASESARPGVVQNTAAGLQRIIDENDVYGGMWARVSLDLFAYEDKSSGVSFGLRSVLKVRDDKPLTSRRASAEDDFAGIAAPPAAAAGGTAPASSLF